MLKYSIFIIILIFAGYVAFGQSNSNAAFELAIKNVITALSKRDSLSLSRYIDNKTGIYILDRIGVFDNYKPYQSINFRDSSYPKVPFYDDVKLTRLKYATLSSFDCERWTKTGTFTDTTRRDHLLSKTARSINERIKGSISAKKINEFIVLENISRRVVIADNNWNSLIIYLSFLNGKWVLTIIDKITCDCSV